MRCSSQPTTPMVHPTSSSPTQKVPPRAPSVPRYPEPLSPRGMSTSPTPKPSSASTSTTSSHRGMPCDSPACQVCHHGARGPECRFHPAHGRVVGGGDQGPCCTGSSDQILVPGVLPHG